MAAAATKPPLELSGWLCTTKNFKYGYEKSVLGGSGAQTGMPSLRKRWATDEVEDGLVRAVLFGTPCGGSNAGSLRLSVGFLLGSLLEGEGRASPTLVRRQWDACLSCSWVSAEFGYQAPSGQFIALKAPNQLAAAELHLGW